MGRFSWLTLIVLGLIAGLAYWWHQDTAYTQKTERSSSASVAPIDWPALIKHKQACKALHRQIATQLQAINHNIRSSMRFDRPVDGGN